MSISNKTLKSLTDTMSDDFPTLTPLTESLNNGSVGSSSSSSSSFVSYISSITWKTWLIIILLLALLGINIFIVLAKGTETTTTIFG